MLHGKTAIIIVIIIIISLLVSFSNEHLFVVFHKNLSDCKSPRVSRTLLSILDNLNNTVVWIILILSLISYFSSPFSKILLTIPNVV